MTKKRILVLMGGRSPEHEVSIISGQNVVANLDKEKYEVLPVVISKDGKRWQLVSKQNLLGVNNILDYKGTTKEIVTKVRSNIENFNIFSERVDCVFIAMHGPFGEDGTVQGMLDLAGLKYTGSGVLASALGMDKIAFRKYLQAEGLNIPKYVVFQKGEDLNKKINTFEKLPYFVKPFNQGSSVGNSLVKKSKDLKKAVNLALKFSNKVLIDEYIKGIEVTVGILGNDSPVALPVTEIVPLKGEFFDYTSKYTESGADEIVPARITNRVANEVQKQAIKVHKILGCRGFSRVDFILKDSTTPYLLEINTIPGLTPMSLLPKAANAAGISYSNLLDRVISYSINKQIEQVGFSKL